MNYKFMNYKEQYENLLMNYKEQYENLLAVIKDLRRAAAATKGIDILDDVDEEQILIDITTAVRCYYSDKQVRHLNPRIQKRFAERLPQLLDYLHELPAPWKPTEDQMNALFTAALYYGSAWENPVSKHLMEIYSHFKNE